MRSLFSLAIVATLLAGCDSGESKTATPTGGGEKVSEDSGPLLKTEFEVKPTFGDYRASDGDAVYSLKVTDKGACSLTRTEDSEKEPKELFSGRWEPTFDGVRCGITRVEGKRKEAEAYFKVTESGYEFKTANLLGDVKFPKAFASPK